MAPDQLDAMRTPGSQSAGHGPDDKPAHVRRFTALLQPDSEYLALVRQIIIGEWAAGSGLARLLRRIAKSDGPSRAIVKPRRTPTDAEIRGAERAYNTRVERHQQCSVAATAPPALAAYFSGSRRVERIELHNFKAIADLELKFSTPAANRESWFMFVGENATGKLHPPGDGPRAHGALAKSRCCGDRAKAS